MNFVAAAAAGMIVWAGGDGMGPPRRLLVRDGIVRCGCASSWPYHRVVQVLGIAFSGAQLLALPVLWAPSYEAHGELLRGKRARITTLHKLVRAFFLGGALGCCTEV